MVSQIDVALDYIAQGFKVFPVKIDKKPLTEHGLKDATQLQVRAEEYWSKYPDAGIAIPTEGLVVVDFDAGHGGLESKEDLELVFGALPATRTHRTGGGGLHYIYRNPNGRNIRNTTAFGGYQGVDIRANGGYIVVPPSFHESGNRYEVLDDVDIAPAPDWLLDMATTRKTAPASELTTDQPIPEGQRNQTLASLAGTMRRRGMPQEAITAALSAVNTKQCQPSLSEDEVIAIAESISRYPPDNGNNTYVHIIRTQHDESEANRNKNATANATTPQQLPSETHKTQQPPLKTQQPLSRRVDEWVRSTVGWWDTPELDRDLGITSTADKNNRREIILRMVDKGLVERHGKISKQFRFVDTRVTSLDFKTATNTGMLPIKWALGVEQFVNIFPGNVIALAGSPNAGKTAFLLQFIYLNQDTFPIAYFCSEMGGVELRDRLMKFPDMNVDTDWKFEPYDRSSDFHDVIKPDYINIVDYLEMTTDLFAVNTYLTAISHKLGSGIAIVALQKKLGARIGRGQEFGLEKPKLYLAMDKHKIRIVKGKSWATKNVDPNDLQAGFKIIDGCQFKKTNDWTWGE